MCGILGIYNLKSRNLDDNLFKKSLLKMSHRGPDGHAIKNYGKNAILGHLRLSIIDLNEKSNQPMEVGDKYSIVFNGEIYNYIELKDELKSLGYTFKTDGDTEVLLKCYEHWGDQCVNRLNGMWAFAIYDIQKNKIFCSRDRFGIKPFNYAIVKDQFIFSSEIKSIIEYFPELKKPNYNTIANFCRTSTGAQHKETWFEGVYRLQPGHNISIKNTQIKNYRYWSYPLKTNKNISFEEAVKTYKELFEDSVKLTLRSDVPIGVTLSAGIDSSSIVGCLRKYKLDTLETYTSVFKAEEYSENEKASYSDKTISLNEGELVEKFAKQFNITPNLIATDFDNMVEQLQRIIYHLESGHGSPAVVPLMQILERAKENVTVVLEGQGADELLAGYTTNNIFFGVIENFRKFKIFSALKILKDFSKFYSLAHAFKLFIRQISNEYPILSKLYNKLNGTDRLFKGAIKPYKHLKDYPKAKNNNFDELFNKHLAEQHSGTLVNLLHYGDALSMANSLESRLPFLDYRLVEFAFRLPWNYKLKGAFGKHIHREAMPGIVPNYVLRNPRKIGFNTPIGQCFYYDTSLLIKPTDILLSETCLSRNLFDKKTLEKILIQHNSKKYNHSNILFRMLSVELWFRQFIDP